MPNLKTLHYFRWIHFSCQLGKLALSLRKYVEDLQETSLLDCKLALSPWEV